MDYTEDKKIEKIEKEIAHKIETKWDLWTPPISIEDVLWLINQLKECREKNKKAKADMENTDLQYFQEKQLITDDLEKWKKDVLQAADDYDKQIEQRTKDACFGAGWEWIQDDFGEQFGYDPTDDTDKGDFKQAIDEAKIE